MRPLVLPALLFAFALAGCGDAEAPTPADAEAVAFDTVAVPESAPEAEPAASDSGSAVVPPVRDSGAPGPN